jgi:hypothetical protein
VRRQTAFEIEMHSRLCQALLARMMNTCVYYTILALIYTNGTYIHHLSKLLSSFVSIELTPWVRPVFWAKRQIREWNS